MSKPINRTGDNLRNIYGVIVADVLRFVLENHDKITIDDAFDKIELKKFLPKGLSETKTRMIKMEELKVALKHAYNNSKKNINLGKGR